MKKQNRVFHITVTKCINCPYGAMPICDLTNDEKYDSSKIHPECPLPTEAEWKKMTAKKKVKK